jgi:molecular chaperone HtpG
LRELLQNGVDAITARREYDSSNSRAKDWSIRLTALTGENGEFQITDDGIGLTRTEAADLLSTVGATSKRDILDFPRQDFLGQFGIGLLSCFMVADQIRVVTQSAKGGPAVEWLGNSNGTFTIRELDESVPVGTSVYLRPRFDGAELLRASAVSQLAIEFGQFLAVPVKVGPGRETINRPAVFADREATGIEIRRFGRALLGTLPVDHFPLVCEETGSRGTAYVLPFSPPPGAPQATRMYLGRMLVSPNLDGILPDWAFFIRACVNSTGLTPTASREAIIEDFALEVTRQAFADAIRNWLVRCAAGERYQLDHFLSVHERAIKQMVPHDPELARIMTGHLTLETSMGRRHIKDLVQDYPKLRYAETLDEYRQVVGIVPGHSAVINAGYLWDAEVTRLAGEIFGVEVERIDVLAELDALEPPALKDRTQAVALEQRATAALAGRDCQVVVRAIGDGTTPAVFVADPELFRRLDRARSSDSAAPLWRAILDRANSAIEASRSGQVRVPTSRLCLNWLNRLVQTLADLDDQAVFERSVQLLYVQAQLAGRRPLTPADRKLLDSALSDLIALSAGVADLPPHAPTPPESPTLPDATTPPD